MSDIASRALDTYLRHLALGSEVFEADGATFVRNCDLPDIYDCNFAFGVTARDDASLDRLVVRLDGGIRTHSTAG